MGKKKTKTRKRKWATQTEVGVTYGLPAVRIGKALQQAGLKIGASVSAKALAEGYAIASPLIDGTPFFIWHRPKIEAVLDGSLPRLRRKEQIVYIEDQLRRAIGRPTTKFRDDKEPDAVDDLIHKVAVEVQGGK